MLPRLIDFTYWLQVPSIKGWRNLKSTVRAFKSVSAPLIQLIVVLFGFFMMFGGLRRTNNNGHYCRLRSPMLISCPECGNKISSHATRCPSCGIEVVSWHSLGELAFDRYWIRSIGKVVTEKVVEGTECARQGKACAWILEELAYKDQESKYHSIGADRIGYLRCTTCKELLRVEITYEDSAAPIGVFSIPTTILPSEWGWGEWVGSIFFGGLLGGFVGAVLGIGITGKFVLQGVWIGAFLGWVVMVGIWIHSKIVRERYFKR
jgi:ribosomal protein L32